MLFWTRFYGGEKKNQRIVISLSAGGQWGLPAPAGEWQRKGVSSDFSIRKLPLDETGCDPGIGVEAGEKSKVVF